MWNYSFSNCLFCFALFSFLLLSFSFFSTWMNMSNQSGSFPPPAFNRGRAGNISLDTLRNEVQKHDRCISCLLKFNLSKRILKKTLLRPWRRRNFKKLFSPLDSQGSNWYSGGRCIIIFHIAEHFWRLYIYIVLLYIY